MRWSGTPFQAVTVAVSIRKLWLEKLLSIPAAGLQDLSKSVGQERTRQRLSVAQQEQGARRVALHGEISQHTEESTQGTLSPTNMHKGTLAEQVSFGSLDLDTHTSRRDSGLHC